MTDDHTPRNIEELAALYAAGALPADERVAVEARLAAGDESLRSAIERFGAVSEALGMAGGSVAPAPEIRQRMLDRAADSRQPQHAGPPAPDAASNLPGLTFVPDPNNVVEAAETPRPDRRPRRDRRRPRRPVGEAAGAPAATAEQTGQLKLALARGAEWKVMAEGVASRTLHLDRRARRITLLVRLAPGVVYPAHFHQEDEECFVVEGDLIVGDHVLGPGDYQFAPANTWHGMQSTRQGCLCVIVTSLANL